MDLKCVLIVLASLAASCGGTTNIFEHYEKKPERLDRAALLMEQGDPAGAQAVLLEQVPPEAGQVLISETSSADDVAYAQKLASSMQGVANGQKILSMYATAQAGVNDVGALNIMVNIMKIDDQQNAGGSSLRLDQAGDDQAIGTFYPAMPAKCSNDSQSVLHGLDKAIAILYATAILNGFDPSDFTSHKVDLIAALTAADMFNNAIFCQVNFICRIMNLDTDGNKSISTTEAAAIGTVAEATLIYSRIQSAIDAVSAMVKVNPKDKTLAKALTRMQDYKTKIDNNSGSTLLEKLANFLVSQSKNR